MLELINNNNLETIKEDSIEFAISNSIEAFQNKWEYILEKGIPCQ